MNAIGIILASTLNKVQDAAWNEKELLHIVSLNADGQSTTTPLG